MGGAANQLDVNGNHLADSQRRVELCRTSKV